MIGTKLGPYEITARLGEGGMGEVYRATDARLRRGVAIKVLPPAFTEDPERLARFEREAQLLAQLQHPNIASIFGLEESEGHQALIMELVEGSTLDQRMTQGALGIGESLRIAMQIAEALEAAHEKGIVHRDLKPQNVKLTPEGTVKVLDFGLAKAMDPVGATSGSASASQLAASPTLTLGATVQGVILGTAGYMAPEQAKGLAVDRRADIWAFGVVLWEMLTGRRLFEGDSVPETLAGVLKNEIDLAALPEETPAAIRRLLRRCLERSPKDRLHDIADARIEVQDATSRIAEEHRAAAVPAPEASAPYGWRLPLATIAAFVIGLVAGWWGRSGPAAPPLVKAEVSPPEGTELMTISDSAGPVVVSPDGRSLAFTARDAEGVTRLYVRPLVSGEAREIRGTEGARFPFWSPDGRSLAFFDFSRLLRVETAGGDPLALAPISASRGGTWGSAGVIVYAPSFESALLQIPESGGEPKPASTLDVGRREGTHRFPSFLPDGHHFLFEVRGFNSWLRTEDGVFVGSIDDPNLRIPLLSHATNALYAGGRLLFVRGGALCAQRFDTDRLILSGPVEILDHDVRFDRRYSFGAFSAAGGVLALQHAREQDASEVVWLDRQGRRSEVVAPAALYDGVDLSPKGTAAVIPRVDPTTLRVHLELLDLTTHRFSPLTYGEVDDYGPVWSPDGDRILFARVGEGGIGLWVRRVDGSERESVFRAESSDELLFPCSWSPDGRHVLVTSVQGSSLPTGYWTLLATGEGELERYTDSRANGDIAKFSPDGAWILFDANEGQGQRAYLARWPDTGGRWQLPDENTWFGRWSKGGREIVYVSGGRNELTALPVDLSSGSPRFGTPERLFPLTDLSVAGEIFDVLPDGERILALVTPQDARPEPYAVVLNWEALLEEE